MAKAKLAKDLVKAITAIDKLVADIQKDTKKVIEAVKELEESRHKEGNDDKKEGV